MVRQPLQTTTTAQKKLLRKRLQRIIIVRYPNTVWYFCLVLFLQTAKKIKKYRIENIKISYTTDFQYILRQKIKLVFKMKNYFCKFSIFSFIFVSNINQTTIKMKKVIHFLVFVLFFINSSCQNQNSNSGKSTETVVKPTVLSSKNYPDALQGFWINMAYLQKLQDGKMPFSQIQKITIAEKGVTSFEISDSSASAGFNFHEGMACTLKNVSENRFEVLNADSNNERAFDLEVISGNHIKIGKTEMSKVGTVKNGVDALDYLLIGGKYSLDNKTVELKEDGTVSGLGDYTHYSILYDYIGEENAPDQLELSTDEEVSTYFAFKIDKKMTSSSQLSIFDLKCLKKEGDNCLKTGVGKLHWKLVKTDSPD